MGLVNAVNHRWCETSLLHEAVLKHVVSRYFILKNLCKGPVLYDEEIYDTVAYLQILRHFTSKMKTSANESDMLCGSTGVTHFQL